MDAIKLKEKYNISGIPVVERNTKKLVGILLTEIFGLPIILNRKSIL